ncbi:MAG: VRR-NUC domain-containing protein [Prevotella salivae]|nr:VRR-NUC domain-containing protein [Segatella salivae]
MNDQLEKLRALCNTPVKRRKPSHEEDRLQITCRVWFDLQHKDLSILLHHSPNEGLLVKRASDGAKRKAMGVRAGFPDFIFLKSNRFYPYLAIELKTQKGKQSEHQIAYQKAIEANGGKYVVVRSLEEFMSEINEYLKNI